MSAEACPRAFEAEAIRDGRLTGPARASFERHATSCAVCAREIGALDAVATAVRSLQYATADELHVRRERTRLLAAFDRELVAPEHAPKARLRTFGPAVVAAIAAVLVFWNVHRRGDPVHPIEASRATIHAESAAIWSEHIENDREIVRIDRGVLSIHVDHARGAHRLLVMLPDGELEDTGTTFTVHVEDAHTTRVAVQEGSVLLRLHGRSPIAIEGGDVWPHAAMESPATGTASAAPSSEPAPIVRRERSPGSTATGPTRDASVEFQTAVAALHRGDARAAAEGFASFLSNHAHDRRAEDAAYLRVIALQRCGDVRATQAAATTYLQRYPTGFRRTEVEAMSQ
jgi:hypothetical protein